MRVRERCEVTGDGIAPPIPMNDPDSNFLMGLQAMRGVGQLLPPHAEGRWDYRKVHPRRHGSCVSNMSNG